jgi:hypothetical protein
MISALGVDPSGVSDVFHHVDWDSHRVCNAHYVSNSCRSRHHLGQVLSKKSVFVQARQTPSVASHDNFLLQED